MAKQSRLPDQPTNVEVAVYVTAILGGAESKIYSERIAARCYELAPSKFSWKLPEYKKWPDKYVVKTALEDAKKEEYGLLVDGAYNLVDTAKDGWRLTHNGALWFHDNSARLERYFGSEASAKPKMAKDQGRMLGRIRKEPLFRQFTRKQSLVSVSPYEFTDMLNCSPDASEDVITLKFERLLNSATLSGDNDISNFLIACAEQFAALMPGRNKREK